MKQALASFLLLIAGVCALNAQPLFRDLSYSEALHKSTLESKPVFLMCYTNWCGHCKKMKEEVLTDSVLNEYFSKYFVCVKIDMEAGEGIMLHNQFAVKMYPTFIFLDHTGTTLYRLMGEFKPEDLIAQAEQSLIPENQLPYLQQQFESDPSDATKCYAYLMALRRGAMDFSPVAPKYFAAKTDGDLLNEINWKIIANGITDIRSPQFQYVLQHQKEFAEIASPNRVQRKINNMVSETLSPFVEAKDTTGYFQKRPDAAAIGLYKVDSLLFLMDRQIYERTLNWDAYRDVCLAGVKKYAWNDYHQLQDMANDFYKHVSDNAALLQAALWAEQATELNQDYATYLLGARLFQKAADKPSALKMAQEGKDLAVKYGWKYDEADQLLQQLQ